MRQLLPSPATSRLPRPPLWQRLSSCCSSSTGPLLPLLAPLLVVHIHGSCRLLLHLLLLPQTCGLRGRMLPSRFLLLCTARAPCCLAQRRQRAACAGAAWAQGDAVLLVQAEVAVTHQEEVH